MARWAAVHSVPAPAALDPPGLSETIVPPGFTDGVGDAAGEEAVVLAVAAACPPAGLALWLPDGLALPQPAIVMADTAIAAAARPDLTIMLCASSSRIPVCVGSDERNGHLLPSPRPEFRWSPYPGQRLCLWD